MRTDAPTPRRLRYFLSLMLGWLTFSTGIVAAQTLSSLVCGYTIMVGGATTVCTATLSAAAGSGGVVVALANSDTTALSIPSSVNVLQGQLTGSFTATTLPVTVLKTPVITATVPGSSRTASLNVNPTASGSIPANSTWTLAGSPYIVSGDVTVQGSATLTIAAGVTVRFNSAVSLLIGGATPGSLQAVGTSGQVITFTANTTTPTAGYWKGIQFATTAATGSSIAYSTVQYGGVTGQWGGIYVAAGSPSISNVTSQTNAHSGITVAASAPTITATQLLANPIGLYIAAAGSPSLQTLTIANSTGYAISQDAAAIMGAVSGLSVSGNGTDGIELRPNGIGAATTWGNFGLPYFATGTVTVNSGTLSIAAGVTVNFTASGQISVAAGSLQAVGTSAQHILFTAKGSTTPGFWRGVVFTNTALASQLAYFDIRYGGHAGSNGNGCLGINAIASTVTVTNITSQSCAHSGISVSASSPTISNSTISANPVGVYITSPNGYTTTPSIQGTSITGNTGYAISQDAQTTMGAFSGNTIAGNGTDAIEIRATTVGHAATWQSLGLSYVMTGNVTVAAAAAPVVTVNSGVTVKVVPGATLLVGTLPTNQGGLIVAGSAAAPITFTSSLPTPTPGSWPGIYLAYATANSQFSYATISYGGAAGYGLKVTPTLNNPIDHVSLTSNQGTGLIIGGGTVSNCNFSGNTAGLNGGQGTDARRNYWGDVSGPSGSGPGSGQSVSAGVQFEPWLGAPASSPQWFSAFTLGNSTFNPSLNINANFNFQTTASGSWTTKVYNSSNALIRTIAGSGTPGNPVWDGKNDGGTPQANGTYTYQLDSTAGGNAAAPLRGRATIDTTRQLTLTGIAVSQAYFSPNGDGVQDTTVLSGTASFDGANFTLNIKNAGGTTVRTITGSAVPGVSITWDGKNGAIPPVTQPDGVYTLALTVTDGSASTSAGPTTTLDNTPPTAIVTTPASGTTLSNVYSNGSTVVGFVGTAADANMQTWNLTWTPCSTVCQAGGGSTSVTSGSLGSVDTFPLTNGSFTFTLFVKDLAGNQTSLVFPETVANFRVTAPNPAQLNGAASGTILLTSVVPFALDNEKLMIKDAGGTTRRTLFNGPRTSPGGPTDSWNGRDDAGNLLPDGGYFFWATVTKGSSSMTFDQTNQFSNTQKETFGNPQTPFDPFNNQALSINYTLVNPGRVFVAFAPTGGEFASCAPPYFCIVNGQFQQSGAHSLTWSGTDLTGAYRPDARYMAIASMHDQYPLNTIVLFGSAPVVTNLQVSPAFYGPAKGNQVVSFDLATYQSQAANVSITFFNQASASILRTISLPTQLAGHVTVNWDGHADNGMLVAAGFYTVTVTATDSRGTVATSSLCTTVQY